MHACIMYAQACAFTYIAYDIYSVRMHTSVYIVAMVIVVVIIRMKPDAILHER